MPSRIEICKNKAEAIRMAQAGLLMLEDVYNKWFHYPLGLLPEWIEVSYGSEYWKKEHFGYLVEDE